MAAKKKRAVRAVRKADAQVVRVKHQRVTVRDRPVPRRATRRWDSWRNLLSGIGTSRDRRSADEFEAEVVSDEEARELLRGDDVAKRICATAPEDAFRMGFDVNVGDKRASEKLGAKLEDLGFYDAFVRAATWEAAYGGAAILPILNDGKALDQELVIAETKSGRAKFPSVAELQVFEPRQLQCIAKYEDILLGFRRYGMPSLYRVVPITGTGSSALTNVSIHASRLVVFPGIRVSVEDQPGCRIGWGDKVLTRCKRVMADFGMTWGAAATLIQDFSQAIIKLTGLAELMAEDKEQIVQARLEIMEQMRSALRALVMDADDDYERKTTSILGLSDLMMMFMYRMSAAAEMPATKLMGIAPSGLNATGLSDNNNWDDVVQAKQTHHYGPKVEQLVRFCLLANDSPTRGIEPDEWSLDWRPLTQETDEQREKNRNMRAQTDIAYIDAGVWTAEEVREARSSGDRYSYELQSVGELKLPPAPDPSQLAEAAAARGRVTGQGNRALIESILALPDDDDEDEYDDDEEDEDGAQ